VKGKKMRVKRNGIVSAVVVALLVAVGVSSWSQSQQNTDERAVLILRNDTNDLVRFLDGMGEMKDRNGRRHVNPGEDAIFELAALNPGQTYTNLNIESDSTNRLRLGPIVIRSGVLYVLLISKYADSFRYDLREWQRFNDREELEMYLEWLYK